jgi:hypothetical protein
MLGAAKLTPTCARYRLHWLSLSSFHEFEGKLQPPSSVFRFAARSAGDRLSSVNSGQREFWIELSGMRQSGTTKAKKAHKGEKDTASSDPPSLPSCALIPSCRQAIVIRQK